MTEVLEDVDEDVDEDRTYKFGELSERAKERARDWWRNHCCNDWEPDFSGFEELAKTFGIDLDTRAENARNGRPT